MGHRQKEIALQLQVSPSTVCRELSRHTVEGAPYAAQTAQRLALESRARAAQSSRKINADLIFQIETRLQKDWSPEQISGYLKKSGVAVSYEWIYQYVWADKTSGGHLYTHLRHRGKKYQHRGSKNAGRGCIPHRIDIQERPAIVEEKIRLGDWEIDLIIGAQQQGAILSMVDRASKYTLLAPLPNKTAAGVTTAILDAFHRPLPDAPQHLVHTITSDNGKEFAAHRQIAAALDCAFFFATPYHSWERGLNEHVNGLVRQYLPKKMTFSHLTSAHTLFIEDRLNHRPRKVLQYRTPYEVWSSNSPAQLIALRS